MKAVLDFGLVNSAKVQADGSIAFYGRVAIANREYKYANRDGSIRKELITRDQLFDKKSIDTLKIQTITHPHAPEDLTPDNYNQYVVGSTGNLVVAGIDGDYLGVVGCIKRRDAINAFHSGVRQLSPGYTRGLTKVGDSLYQTDREYFELSLVHQGRGGNDVKIKDGYSTRDVFQFCTDQIDEDLIKLWTNQDGLNEQAIDRLLTHGNLSPPAVNLGSHCPDKTDSGHCDEVEDAAKCATSDDYEANDEVKCATKSKKNKVMQKVKIGDSVLLVDETCADSAIELAAEYSVLKSKAQVVEKSVTDAIDDKAKISALESKTQELSQRLTDSMANRKSELVSEVTKLQAANKEITVFASAGHKVDSAKKALDSFDIEGYHQAIVKTVCKDQVADELVNVYYKAHLDALSKHGFANKDDLYQQPNGMGMGANQGTIGNFMIPNQLQQMGGYGGNSLGNQMIAEESIGGLGGEMDIIMGRSGVSTSKPADTSENGWY